MIRDGDDDLALNIYCNKFLAFNRFKQVERAQSRDKWRDYDIEVRENVHTLNLRVRASGIDMFRKNIRTI